MPVAVYRASQYVSILNVQNTEPNLGGVRHQKPRQRSKWTQTRPTIAATVRRVMLEFKLSIDRG